MSNIASNELEYVAWQNRALRFYLGARLLHRNELYAPAAYSAAISIELLLKGTLIYLDRSFNPLAAGHGIAKLTRMVNDKAGSGQGLMVPIYFYHEQRYLNVSRYPRNGNGVVIPASFIEDLDRVFVDLTLLVPFQHNTELKRALAGKGGRDFTALRHKNQQMRRLRTALRVPAR